MIDHRISLVLPVKFGAESSAQDLDRLINVGIASIDKFFDREALGPFIVIASSRDLDLIRPAALSRAPQLPFVFVNEVQLCPPFGRPDDGADGTGWQGWHKQQILKIAAASIVDTAYYMTLDDDVTLTRRASTVDLIRQGKAILSHFELSDYPQYLPWYQSCCEVLKVSPAVLKTSSYVMGFTPQLIVTKLMLDLQEEICRLWPGGSFVERLLQLSGISIPLTQSRRVNRVIRRLTGRRAIRPPLDSSLVERSRQWTEHQLYWTYLQKRGLAEEYYTRNAPQLSAFGFWKEGTDREQIDDWLSSEFDSPHEHYFSVFGSRVRGIDREYLNAQMRLRLASVHTE